MLPLAQVYVCKRERKSEREQNIERNREIKYERNTETYRAIF